MSSSPIPTPAKHVMIRQHLLELGFDERQTEEWIEDARQVDARLRLDPVWWRDRNQLDQTCRQLSYSPLVRDAFLAAARRIEEEAPQWWTFVALADLLYRSPDRALRTRALSRPGPCVKRWGELASLSRALIHLTGLGAMIQAHRSLGIPQWVTIDTARDLAMRIELHHREHGTLGIVDKGWLSNHSRLEVFALGRLQYARGRYQLPFRILANPQGRCALLLEPGLVMRADGLFASADQWAARDAPDNWTSTLQETNDAWQGQVIDAQGKAQSALQRFSKRQWKQAIQQGDPILCVHIPEGAPLDPSDCMMSLDASEAFFPEHLKFEFKAWTCVSWLMAPELSQATSPASNLAQFQSMFQPAPIANANDRQMFERVFKGIDDPQLAPQDTSLRRAILKHMQDGQRFRTAAGIRMHTVSPDGLDPASSN